MNGWDLKILYRDLESWKKWLKKMEWNRIVWRIFKKLKKMKNGNGMEWEKWVYQTINKITSTTLINLSTIKLTSTKSN